MALPELTDEQRAWYILRGYEIVELRNIRLYYLSGKSALIDGIIKTLSNSNESYSYYIHSVLVSKEEYENFCLNSIPDYL